MKRSILGIFALFGAVACGDSPTELKPEARVDSVQISPTSATLEVGDTLCFTATAYVRGNVSRSVKWSTTIGTIDQAGCLAAPITTGTGEVHVQSVADTTKFARATVVVNPMPPPPLPRSITFTSVSSRGKQNIFVMSADGSNILQLTDSLGQNIQSAWSPDGRRIAFARGGACSTSVTSIYTMDPDGTNLVNVSQCQISGQDPAWSPDGNRIAFRFVDNAINGGDDTAGLAVMNSDGTGIVKIKSVPCVGGCSPPHTPDWLSNNTIVFSDSDGDIHAINLDGTGEVNLTNHPSVNVAPAVSPDHSKIAFVSDPDPSDGFFDAEIYVMNADGTGWVRLTTNSAKDLDPDWSPDGSKIVFARRLSAYTTQEIYVMNADGTGQVNISNSPRSHERWPNWRPQ